MLMNMQNDRQSSENTEQDKCQKIYTESYHNQPVQSQRQEEKLSERNPPTEEQDNRMKVFVRK
jgi:hypothetical protein